MAPQPKSCLSACRQNLHDTRSNGLCHLPLPFSFADEQSSNIWQEQRSACQIPWPVIQHSLGMPGGNLVTLRREATFWIGFIFKGNLEIYGSSSQYNLPYLMSPNLPLSTQGDICKISCKARYQESVVESNDFYSPSLLDDISWIWIETLLVQP